MVLSGPLRRTATRSRLPLPRPTPPLLRPVLFPTPVRPGRRFGELLSGDQGKRPAGAFDRHGQQRPALLLHDGSRHPASAPRGSDLVAPARPLLGHRSHQDRCGRGPPGQGWQDHRQPHRPPGAAGCDRPDRDHPVRDASAQPSAACPRPGKPRPPPMEGFRLRWAGRGRRCLTWLTAVVDPSRTGADGPAHLAVPPCPTRCRGKTRGPAGDQGRAVRGGPTQPYPRNRTTHRLDVDRQTPQGPVPVATPPPPSGTRLVAGAGVTPGRHPS